MEATPRPKMARMKGLIPNGYGAGRAGAVLNPRAGSVSLCSSMVTSKSIQGRQDQMAVQLAELEEAQWTIK